MKVVIAVLKPSISVAGARAGDLEEQIKVLYGLFRTFKNEQAKIKKT